MNDSSLGNRNLTEPEEIEKALKLGEYIKNGMNPCERIVLYLTIFSS